MSEPTIEQDLTVLYGALNVYPPHGQPASADTHVRVVEGARAALARVEAHVRELEAKHTPILYPGVDCAGLERRIAELEADASREPLASVGIELRHGKFYERGRGQAISKAHVLEALALTEGGIAELEALVAELRGRELEPAPPHVPPIRAGDAMALAIERLVVSGRISARSEAADTALDWRDPDFDELRATSSRERRIAELEALVAELRGDGYLGQEDADQRIAGLEEVRDSWRRVAERLLRRASATGDEPKP